MIRKTKIVCTIGPATASLDALRELAEAGMDVARLNFSHGTHAWHGEVIDRIKRLREDTGRNIGLLQDLSGPKIRLGDLPETGVELKTGGYVRLTAGGVFQEDPGLSLPVMYEQLLEDLPAGAIILLDDGLVRLRVENRQADALVCSILHGGKMSSRKGVNFPGAMLSCRAPTEKDMEDLAFGIRQGVDFVALSFVQTPDDVRRLRSAINDLDGRVAVIAKVEKENALRNLDAILEACDGVMVARGDLGIETDMAMLPIYQKKIVRRANLKGLFDITATQMLDSMIRNPMPTRAEVTDVANAIYDGSDAIMLSGETAMGAFPMDAVRMMRKVAEKVEANLGLDRGWIREAEVTFTSSAAVAAAVCEAASRLNARYILAHTMSGQTARLIALHRPSTPIIALTPLPETFYQLSIVWGVEALLLPGPEPDFLKSVAVGIACLKKRRLLMDGDQMVISAGIPAGRGGTNIMKIHVVGEPLT